MGKPERRTPIRSRRKMLLVAAVALPLFSAICAGAWLYPGSERLRVLEVRAQRLAAGLARTARDFLNKAPAVILDQPYFAVQEIKVFGAKSVDRAEIVEATGLQRGTSIWRIDPGALERKIEKHPWVKQAIVRRELPQRVVVTVEEWKPAGIVTLQSLYYVDAQGIVFKEVNEADPVDLPVITGLREADMRLEEGTTRDKLAQVLGLAAEVEGANLRLSEIRFLPDGEIVLYPASARVPFNMGWGNWEGKLLRLKRFLREWHGQEAHFAGVDLSFMGQAVVRLRRTL